MADERIPFRGLGLTCRCVVESLPWVELDMIRRGIIRNNMDLAQLGYRSDVSASAGTHAAGGCTDGWGQWDEEAIDVQRLWGWTSQRRDLRGIGTHWHGWPYGCPHLSPAAQAQSRDWDRRDAGLQGGGQVVGRWPIKRWNDALEERKGPLLREVADAVADELIRRREQLAAPKTIANEVLRGDHVNNSGFASGSEGTRVSLNEALIAIQGRLIALPKAASIASAVEAAEAAEEKALTAQLDALSKKIDGLVAAVTALPKAPL
jgi:hypothetical protein